jgi:hypothetical protein
MTGNFPIASSYHRTRGGRSGTGRDSLVLAVYEVPGGFRDARREAIRATWSETFGRSSVQFRT